MIRRRRVTWTRAFRFPARIGEHFSSSITQNIIQSSILLLSSLFRLYNTSATAKSPRAETYRRPPQGLLHATDLSSSDTFPTLPEHPLSVLLAIAKWARVHT